LIQKGDWKGAKVVAEAWVKDKPKAAVALFVEDAAGLMTKTCKAPSRSTLDYPYSDKETCDKLLAWTQDLLVADPKNSKYLTLNALVYILGRRDFEHAFERLEKVLETEPDNSLVLALVGAGYGAQNRLDDAVRVSEKAIKLDPDCASAYDNLGMVQLTRGDRAKAEEYYKKAVACTGADAMHWFDLGTIYVVQGKLQDGKAALLKAVELCPNLMQPHWNLAGLYFNLGMKDDCIRECKKVVELAPDSVEGRKAANNLRALGQ
jgi:tetratricopeptide (TPR) repeat protein